MTKTKSLSINKIENTVIHGDSIEVMRKLPSASVDMIFADPPYNLQIGNTGLTRPDGTAVNAVLDDWDKFDTFTAYDNFTKDWLTEAKRILTSDGTIWVIGSYHNIYRVGAMMQNLGFWMLNDIIWQKSNPMPNFRGRRFTNAHEILLWATQSRKSQYVFNYQSMKMLNDDTQMRSDWVLPICNGSERIKIRGNKAHPTQKPEALLMRVLLAASEAGGLVLDPFFGSGTTGAVAKRLHRRFIGIEREAEYVDIAKKRIAKIEPIADLSLLATPSPVTQPKISFGNLVTEGLIQPGDTLRCPKGKFRVRVRADGSLVYANGKRDELNGSIHTLGAKLLEQERCNGWVFWQLERGEKIIPIENLRADMRLKLRDSG